MNARILLIEDDQQIRRFLRQALEANECTVQEAACLRDGERLLAEASPELILLDLGLPDGDGLDFITKARSWCDCPIIVISARHHESIKVKALTSGADDYLTKPFGMAELQARLNIHLRRWRGLLPGREGLLHCGSEVEIDLDGQLVRRAGELVSLTPNERKLLFALARQPDRLLTQKQLLLAIWGPTHESDGHYLRIAMAKLRQKLETLPARPQFLITETGVGYRLISGDPSAKPRNSTRD